MKLFLIKPPQKITQGDVALSLPLVAHPRLTADMRFGSCRASTQIATQLLISANVIRHSKNIILIKNVE